MKSLFALVSSVFLLGMGVCNGHEFKIASPAKNAVFEPGDTFQVKLDTVDGFKPRNGITFYCAFTTLLLKTPPPYEFDVAIPQNFKLGPVELTAVMRADLPMSSDVSEIRVETQKTIESIEVSPKQFLFKTPNDPILYGFIVHGVFSDGHKKIISNSSKTKYSSRDKNVAALDNSMGDRYSDLSETQVRCVNTGKTVIDISYEGKTIEVPVEVGQPNQPAIGEVVGLPGELTYFPPVIVGTSLKLDGSPSKDPDGGPITLYKWMLFDQPAGSKATIPNPDQAVTELIPDLPGLYAGRFIVQDSRGEGGGKMWRFTAIIPFSSEKSTITASVEKGDSPKVRKLRVSVLLLNNDGKPVAGQPLTLYHLPKKGFTDDPLPWEGVDKVTTNAEGKAVFEVNAPVVFEAVTVFVKVGSVKVEKTAFVDLSK